MVLGHLCHYGRREQCQRPDRFSDRKIYHIHDTYGPSDEPTVDNGGAVRLVKLSLRYPLVCEGMDISSDSRSLDCLLWHVYRIGLHQVPRAPAYRPSSVAFRSASVHHTIGRRLTLVLHF